MGMSASRGSLGAGRRLPALLVGTGLLLSGCSSDSADTEPQTEDTSTVDSRVGFGCALHRGLGAGGGAAQKYSVDAAEKLYQAALEQSFLDGSTYRPAALLWQATDEVQAERRGARAALLDLCTSEGFTDTATLEDLAPYACGLVEELVRERPALASYGEESEELTVGDPRRHDVEAVSLLLFTVTLTLDQGQWLDQEALVVAFDSGDEERYATSLAATRSTCGAS